VDAARHDRICGIFEQAIALPQEQRAALLEQCCSGDVALRAEVESLIAAHQRSNPILDAGALALLTEPEDEEHPDLTGQRIGRYELKRVIARGGMGIVYEAMQEEPRRIVAVKVLRRLGSPSSVRRFHEEAQILARLSHPHIAHIYEAGTHIDGSSRGDNEHLPFFAMEYISAARPLTEFAIERRLPIRERLLLFIRVCEAVQHGHQKGIIHRDLKPANILVNADGVPKVIDFGVARVLDLDGESRTRHTLAGRVIGTLPYCSPEQIDENAGDIDSRSDVYALGAVLYEILAGVPAFKTDGRSTWQTMTMIRESSPRPLRELDRGLRGNLDAIVSRAMEKNPDRRYQSVESLRRDIERHLAGEPIEARPESRWIGATRWMGRHPVWTTSAAASALGLTILSVTLAVVWYGLRQPARVVVASDGRIGHVTTAFGRPLATLGGEPDSRVIAKLVNRPQEFGGGEILLMIVSSGKHSTADQLWACDPKRLSDPLWRTSSTNPNSLPPLPAEWNLDRIKPGYGAYSLTVADVLNESPGEEVIVVRKQRGGSLNLISVRDLRGTELFDAWHIGDIGLVHWWEEANLLVCAGVRQWVTEVESHGFLNPPPYPKVVFALRPQFGVSTSWLNEAGWPPGIRAGSDVSQWLAWYKVLWPRDWARWHDPVRTYRFDGDSTSGPRLNVIFASIEHGAFNLILDSAGNAVSWDWTDEVRQRAAELPTDAPTLVNWPPPAEHN